MVKWIASQIPTPTIARMNNNNTEHSALSTRDHVDVFGVEAGAGAVGPRGSVEYGVVDNIAWSVVGDPEWSWWMVYISRRGLLFLYTAMMMKAWSKALCAVSLILLAAAIGVGVWLAIRFTTSSSSSPSTPPGLLAPLPGTNTINDSYQFIASHSITQAQPLVGWSGHAIQSGGVFTRFFPNTAFTNVSTGQSVTVSPSFGVSSSSLPSGYSATGYFSVMLAATLAIASPTTLTFQCTGADPTQSLLVWLDDQLICSSMTPINNLITTMVFTYAGTYQAVVKGEYANINTTGGALGFQLQWNQTNIPSSALNAQLPVYEARRLEDKYLQRQTGWGTASNYGGLQYFLFPAGLGIVPVFLQQSTGQNFTVFEIGTLVPLPGVPNGNPAVIVTPGLHSLHTYNALFYAELTLTFTASNTIILVSATVDVINTGSLVVRMMVIQGNAADWSVALSLSFGYGRVGSCVNLLCTPQGLPQVQLYSSTNLAFDVSTHTLVFSSGSSYSLAAASTLLAANAATVTSLYGSMYSSANQVSVQAATNLLGWLYIYTPVDGMTTVVIRNSNLPTAPNASYPGRYYYGQADAIFDWDSNFMSNVLAWLGPYGKTQMLQTYLAVTKTKTMFTDGTMFIPDYYKDGIPQFATTQPCISARVLLDIVQRYGTTDPDVIYLTNLVVDDIYNFINFYWLHRMEGNGTATTPPSFLFAYSYFSESGMDNSDVYDGTQGGHLLTDPRTGIMSMYDIMLSSLVASECTALLTVYELMGFASTDAVYADVLQYRAQVVAQSIQDWNFNSATQIYNYRYLADNSGNPWRTTITPTTFFPMLTGIPTVAAAEWTITNILQSPTGFGFSDDMLTAGGVAKYGIASIDIADPKFGPAGGGYWNGPAWPATNFILYWCLTHPKYQQSAIIQRALAQLLTTTEQLWRFEYDLYGHIHEDQSVITGYGCNSTETASYPYHGWGSLLPYMSLRAEQQVSWPDGAWFPAVVVS